MQERPAPRLRERALVASLQLLLEKTLLGVLLSRWANLVVRIVPKKRQDSPIHDAPNSHLAFEPQRDQFLQVAISQLFKAFLGSFTDGLDRN